MFETTMKSCESGLNGWWQAAQTHLVMWWDRIRTNNTVWLSRLQWDLYGFIHYWSSVYSEYPV